MYPNCEDSNYIRSPFTTHTSTKMPANHTQNNKTLIGSDIEWAKKKLRIFFTKSFKISRCFLLLFWMSSVAQFHHFWEICNKYKLSTKSKTETIGAYLHSNNCNQNKYYFQTNLKEHCHLGKIGLNFGFWSPTKFVNHFSFFEKFSHKS